MKNQKEIFNEFDKHLMNDEIPSKYFNSILNTDLMNVEPFNLLKNLSKINQNLKHHPEGSVWNHTMMVVDRASIKKGFSSNKRVFMWAALLHDIGKGSTTKIRKGRITSYDHDKVGKVMTEKFLGKLTFDDEFIENVSSLVRWHMQPLFISKGMRFSDPNSLKKEVSVEEVALLSICDRLGRGDMSKKKIKEEEKSIDLFLQKTRKARNV